MKKLIFLMALIICLGCVLLTACIGDDVAIDTDNTAESTVDTTEVDETTDAKEPAENENKTPVTDDNTKPSETPDNGSTGDVSNGDINESKDAYADDIYSNVTPGIIG